MYPLIRPDPADVKSFPPRSYLRQDEWAGWLHGVADRYMAERSAGGFEDKPDPPKPTPITFALAFVSFGRWPVPASPGKKQS